MQKTPPTVRQQKIDRVARARQPGLIVVLEDIHDPHNAAAILRSCDAFGIQDVYFIFDQEKQYNPRRVGKSSSSTANKWLTYRIFKSSAECFRALKRQKHVTIGTALADQSEDIFTADLAMSKLALVVGNEHRGLSDYALTHCDRLLTIPMRGMVQSLNVSVTTGICLFEITRQRQQQPHTFTPTARELRATQALLRTK